MAGRKTAAPTSRAVKYVGISHVREITRDDWKTVDVDHDTLRWHRGNNWTVPIEDIGDAALPFIEADEELVFVGGEPKTEGEPDNNPEGNGEVVNPNA